MLNLKRKLSVLILALAVPAGLSAQDFVFNTLTPNEGFPSRVNDIFVEDYGFAWVASNEGLVRIDNSNFTVYSSFTTGDTLPSNNILKVTEDPDGNIWVLTDKGMSRFNQESGLFETATTSEDGEEIPVIAWSVFQEGDGFIVGSGNKLYRYSEGSMRLKLLKEFMLGTDYPVTGMFRWDDSRILLHSRNKTALLYNYKDNEIEQLPFSFERNASVMFVDADGGIWCSPYNRGLQHFDHNGNLLQEFTAGNHMLHSNIILCITETVDGIWAGTDGGGIAIISKEDGSVRTLRHERDDSAFLPADTIQALFSKNNGTVWAGRVRGGLISIRNSWIQSYLSGADQYRSKSEGITALYEENDGNILVGSDGAGIIRFRQADGSFQYFPETNGLKIFDIARLDRNRLLISTVAEGFYTFNLTNGAITRFTFPDAAIEEFAQYSGTGVYLANGDDNILFALADRICRYSTSTGKCECLPLPPDTEAGELRIVPSRAGSNYFHSNSALYYWDKKAGMLQKLMNISKDARINSAAHDGQESIWMATDDGIGRYSIKEDKYYPVDSFFMRGAQSIIYDKNGRVWVGTHNRLFLYFPENGDVVRLGESEGARDNEYLPNSRLVTDGGHIFMGGVKGLQSIDPDIQLDFTGTTELVLTDVFLNGERLVNKTGLRINPDYKSLDISVFAKEERLQRSKAFRFKLEGGRGDETSISFSPTYSILNHQAGKYKVYASCTTINGRWTDWTEVFDFRVRNKWYLSWWFFAAIAALLTLSAYHRIGLILKERRKRDIRESDKQRIKFLVNVSHELRTPLTLVLGPLGRILKEMPEDDPNYSTLSNINRQANRMKSLLNTVLTAHKIEEGASSLKLQTRPFNEWIGEVTGGFVDEARGRGITITTDFCPDVTEVAFDEDKCQIVFSNILINALKHSPENSTIKVSTICRRLDAGMVRVTISDQGSGIKMKDPSRLFQRFVQETDEKSGFGIGLSYCKTIVDMHKGNIGAYNNENGGATFYFEIPCCLQQDDDSKDDNRSNLKALASEIIQHHRAHSLKEVKVLLVDDNMEFRNYIKSELDDKVRNTYVAGNGKEALDILQKSSDIDIILSDAMMPVMDGFQLCSAVKEDAKLKSIPFVLLTARSDDNSRSIGYRSGADGYLVKPFEIEALFSTITNLLKIKN